MLTTKQALARREYDANPVRCGMCQKAMPFEKRERKFCSQSCNGQHNANRTRKVFSRGCQFCGKEFVPTHQSGQFCSQKCSTDSRFDLTDSELEFVSSKRCRSYLIAKYGAKCFDCGWDKKNVVTGNCPIELEHIDGNSNNNKRENLKLLCPNCHSLTATYKNLNRGKGRFWRAQRYRDGKSY